MLTVMQPPTLFSKFFIILKENLILIKQSLLILLCLSSWQAVSLVPILNTYYKPDHITCYLLRSFT